MMRRIDENTKLTMNEVNTTLTMNEVNTKRSELSTRDDTPLIECVSVDKTECINNVKTFIVYAEFEMKLKEQLFETHENESAANCTQFTDVHEK